MNEAVALYLGCGFIVSKQTSRLRLRKKSPDVNPWPIVMSSTPVSAFMSELLPTPVGPMKAITTLSFLPPGARGRWAVFSSEPLLYFRSFIAAPSTSLDKFVAVVFSTKCKALGEGTDIVSPPLRMIEYVTSKDLKQAVNLRH
jgi:hypothetical protein